MKIINNNNKDAFIEGTPAELAEFTQILDIERQKLVAKVRRLRVIIEEQDRLVDELAQAARLTDAERQAYIDQAAALGRSAERWRAQAECNLSLLEALATPTFIVMGR